jgi:superfamily II DNA or RNA helicase
VRPYADFVAEKRRLFRGNAVDYQSRGPHLYPFQRDLVARSLERGRSAIFADCGLGKTIMELEWGTNVPGRVLLLAPLAVAHQIEREAERFGYDALVGNGSGDEKIVLTNYEKLHRFNPDDFSAIVLDESSILKSYDGKTRMMIVESFRNHRYKLAATATPAPNDFMELGNHAEFLGAPKTGGSRVTRCGITGDGLARGRRFCEYPRISDIMTMGSRSHRCDSIMPSSMQTLITMH